MPDNNSSILDSTKKALGIDAGNPAFDAELIMFINGVFSTLHQLGVGPVEGYMIEGNEELWDTFTGGSPIINSVKTYMYLRVRLLFDPPATSFAIDAIDRQAKELEFRLIVAAEPAIIYPTTTDEEGDLV